MRHPVYANNCEAACISITRPAGKTLSKMFVTNETREGGIGEERERVCELEKER